jgi:hypothetical protein
MFPLSLFESQVLAVHKEAGENSHCPRLAVDLGSYIDLVFS